MAFFTRIREKISKENTKTKFSDLHRIPSNENLESLKNNADDYSQKQTRSISIFTKKGSFKESNDVNIKVAKKHQQYQADKSWDDFIPTTVIDDKENESLNGDYKPNPVKRLVFPTAKSEDNILGKKVQDDRFISNRPIYHKEKSPKSSSFHTHQHHQPLPIKLKNQEEEEEEESKENDNQAWLSKAMFGLSPMKSSQQHQLAEAKHHLEDLSHYPSSTTNYDEFDDAKATYHDNDDNEYFHSLADQETEIEEKEAIEIEEEHVDQPLAESIETTSYLPIVEEEEENYEMIDTVFSKARHDRQDYVINMLLNHDFHPNSRDLYGNTIFHICAQNNNRKLASKILKISPLVDINAINKKGFTPLDYCDKYGFMNMRIWLVGLGGKIGHGNPHYYLTEEEKEQDLQSNQKYQRHSPISIHYRKTTSLR
jgi:hypothetical protein